MCGIVGYKGKRNVKDVLVEGLSTLEYRGYDSAGIAVLDNNKVRIVTVSYTHLTLPTNSLV